MAFYMFQMTELGLCMQCLSVGLFSEDDDLPSTSNKATNFFNNKQETYHNLSKVFKNFYWYNLGVFQFLIIGYNRKKNFFIQIQYSIIERTCKLSAIKQIGCINISHTYSCCRNSIKFNEIYQQSYFRYK